MERLTRVCPPSRISTTASLASGNHALFLPVVSFFGDGLDCGDLGDRSLFFNSSFCCFGGSNFSFFLTDFFPFSREEIFGFFSFLGEDSKSGDSSSFSGIDGDFSEASKLPPTPSSASCSEAVDFC